MNSKFVDGLLLKLLIKYPTIKMIHSEQGSQYTAKSYTNILKSNNIEISYSRKGYPYHNAWIESFHATLKREQIYNLVLMNIDDINLACFDCIDGFYNNTRIHEAIGYKTPEQFEEDLLNNKIIVLDTKTSTGILSYTGEMRQFAI